LEIFPHIYNYTDGSRCAGQEVSSIDLEAQLLYVCVLCMQIRVGIPVTHAYGMEDLLYKYGVDVHFQAHEHSYERMWPVYNLVVRSVTVTSTVCLSRSLFSTILSSSPYL